jgi:hypothetical protein
MDRFTAFRKANVDPCSPKHAYEARLEILTAPRSSSWCTFLSSRIPCRSASSSSPTSADFFAASDRCATTTKDSAC